MRVAILHHTLNSCGGGERVALHAIKALMEAGHDVVLGTVERTDWGKVVRVMGVELPRIPEERYLTKQLRRFGIYQRPLTALHVARFRRECDVIVNTHGDVMPLPTDITYLHFPVFALLAEEPWRYYSKYLKSAFWRAYFEPYRVMQKRLAKWAFSKSLLLTNSRFSRSVIRKYIGRDAIVIYPPVEVGSYLRLAENVDREDAVIVISRFAPEKNLHLLPFIARELPKVRFFVVGSVRGYQSESYLKRIARAKEKLGLKNLVLVPNAPHSTKLKLLGRCKVFLHLMPYEHFGIAVVEGLASGCIPVVHRSGGAWIDIVEEGRYGVGYETLSPKDVAEAIEVALNRWTPKLAKLLSASALRFSDERFRKEIVYVVESYASA